MKIVSFKDESGRVGGGVLSADTIRRFPASDGDDVLAFIELGAALPLGEELSLKNVTLLAPLRHNHVSSASD